MVVDEQSSNHCGCSLLPNGHGELKHHLRGEREREREGERERDKREIETQERADCSEETESGNCIF